MKTAESALVLATVWLSPAALLGLGPLLLADGTRGLWAPLVLGSGALLAILLLARPWSRRAGEAPLTLSALARHRWPSAGRILTPLAVGDVGSALLFLWAQLAAGREVAQALGWSPWVALGVAAVVLALAVGRDERARVLAGPASTLALLGLVLPLAAVLAATTPWWPGVWAEVASRPRTVFSGGGVWTTEGRPVRGTGAEATILFSEEQRATLLGRGRVRLDHWEGGEFRRDVTTEIELTLRSGDRLVVPDGFSIRFQPGRRIPGAPAAGPDWLAPSGRRSDWRALLGLGATLLLGAVGLAPVHAALPAESSVGSPAARAGATMVVLGVVLGSVWAVYGTWLTPEIYMAGVAGVEMYELPGSVAALGASGRPLRILALAGLAAGGVAAALAALRGMPRGPSVGFGRAQGPGASVIAIASLLALLTPVRPWPLLLAAFALGASTGTPAAVLACWGERVTARGVGAGAGLGLALFGGLSIVGLWGLWGPMDPARPLDGSWLGWVVAWPALVAMPVNTLTAWLLASRGRTLPRRPLPPGLAGLHA